MTLGVCCLGQLPVHKCCLALWGGAKDWHHHHYHDAQQQQQRRRRRQCVVADWSRQEAAPCLTRSQPGPAHLLQPGTSAPDAALYWLHGARNLAAAVAGRTGTGSGTC
jgi:hypothetical protein